MVYFILGIFIPFFSILFYCNEFDKMQIPYTVKSIAIYPFCIWFVWRRPEFAFLCAGFKSAHFFIFNIKEQNYEKLQSQSNL